MIWGWEKTLQTITLLQHIYDPEEPKAVVLFFSRSAKYNG